MKKKKKKKTWKKKRDATVHTYTRLTCKHVCVCEGQPSQRIIRVVNVGKNGRERERKIRSKFIRVPGRPATSLGFLSSGPRSLLIPLSSSSFFHTHIYTQKHSELLSHLRPPDSNCVLYFFNISSQLTSAFSPSHFFFFYICMYTYPSPFSNSPLLVLVSFSTFFLSSFSFLFLFIILELER